MKSEKPLITNHHKMADQNSQSRRVVLKKLSGIIAAATMARWRGITPGYTYAASGVKVPTPMVSAMGTVNTRFFSADEKETLATVADLIIPTDEISPGARAAGVHDWIDFVVANSPAEVQQRWCEGLAALDRAAEKLAGHSFLQLAPDAQRRLLEELAQHETAPSSPGERFFVLAKEATVNGYYTSEIGLMTDLRFQGGSYINEPEASCPAKIESKIKPASR